MKETEKAYIAGLVDGEGCISICRRKKKQRNNSNWYYEPQVAVTNTDRRLLDFLIDLYGGWIAIVKGKKDNHKTGYHWKITGDNMRTLLKDILPYLKSKEKQAKILLQFPKYGHRGWGGAYSKGRTEEELKRQKRYWGRMRTLNHKGTKPLIKALTGEYGEFL